MLCFRCTKSLKGLPWNHTKNFTRDSLDRTFVSEKNVVVSIIFIVSYIFLRAHKKDEVEISRFPKILTEGCILIYLISG